MRKTGMYSDNHFIPNPLPPHDPPFNFSIELATLYGDTILELNKLNEVIAHIADIKSFIKAYVIKEALLTSAIEGIHTTLLDVYTQPLLDSKPNKETQLVINYTQALQVAVSMLRKDGLPISSRVICSAHKTLMFTGEADPGNYRKQGVRVGSLIPPQASQVPKLMAELEEYINNDQTLPPLIKAGLAHVQFETIHPFLDGNGRIGRLLIVLILLDSNLLSEPILYPSYYFKKHHANYYHQLDVVRLNGDFEGWITFYLKAIRESSVDAYRRIKDVEVLKQDLTVRIQEDNSAKMVDTQLKALTILFGCPIITIQELSLQLDMAYNTASKVATSFIELGLLVEETGQKRGKLFRFKPYWDILEREY